MTSGAPLTLTATVAGATRKSRTSDAAETTSTGKLPKVTVSPTAGPEAAPGSS